MATAEVEWCVSCHGFGGGIGQPANRQGAALFNQGVDALNHGIPGKASFMGRLQLSRRGRASAAFALQAADPQRRDVFYVR